MLRKCPLCCVEWNDSLRAYKRIDFYGNSFPAPEYNACFRNDSVYVCSNCHAGITYPYHTKKELMEYYAKYGRALGISGRYHPHDSDVLTYALYPAESVSQRYIARIMLASAFREFKAGENYLEIGAGYGKGFKAAGLLLPPMNYFAVEPDVSACEALRSINVNVINDGFTEETVDGFGDRKFHLIIMSSVLDHLNPDEVIPTLKLVKRLLAKDGIFECNVWNYRDMDPPSLSFSSNHLTFFTQSGLHFAMENSGYHVDFMKSAGRLCADAMMVGENTSVSSEITLSPFNFLKILKSLCPRSIKDFIRRLIFRIRMHYRSKLTIDQLLTHMKHGGNFQYGQDREYLVCVVTHKEFSNTSAGR